MTSDQLSEPIITEGLATAILGCRVLYYSTTGSTMDEAKKAALRNAPEGTLVVADEQSAGRGRFQRSWVSPQGVNLYLSVILRPSKDHASQLGMMASLALARALGSISNDRCHVTIKWPNDLRIGNKKVAGILIESSLSEEPARNFSIIGIGVNVNFDPSDYPEIRDLATSLQSELGHSIPRISLLKAIMEEIEELYFLIRLGGSVQEEWSSFIDTLGQDICVAIGEEIYEGYAQGVTEDGSLIIRLRDGSLKVLAAGEVTLRKSEK